MAWKSQASVPKSFIKYCQSVLRNKPIETDDSKVELTIVYNGEDVTDHPDLARHIQSFKKIVVKVAKQFQEE